MKAYCRYIAPVLLLAILLSGLNGCLVSRLARPRLTGAIYDADTKLPLPDCTVNETMTDQLGHYELLEQRYREFTLRHDHMIIICGSMTEQCWQHIYSDRRGAYRLHIVL